MIGYYTVQHLSSEFGTKKVPPPNLKKNSEQILLKASCERWRQHFYLQKLLLSFFEAVKQHTGLQIET
jgi:hypothetical protein